MRELPAAVVGEGRRGRWERSGDKERGGRRRELAQRWWSESYVIPFQHGLSLSLSSLCRVRGPFSPMAARNLTSGPLCFLFLSSPYLTSNLKSPIPFSLSTSTFSLVLFWPSQSGLGLTLQGFMVHMANIFATEVSKTIIKTPLKNCFMMQRISSKYCST
jgi:hypothetical protein